MTQQMLNNHEIRKYANQATDGGVKLLFKAIAWSTWGIITFVKQMIGMVLGK